MKKNNRIELLISLLLCASMVFMTACSGKISVPDEYKYDDLSVYIKLGEYKGIEYEKASTKVSDDELQAEIDSQLSDTKESKKVTKGKAKSDSVVNIDYAGTMDGVAFDGGTAEGYDLDLANSNFISGFAEAIVGHSVGENFDINVTFPEDYGNSELAGKPAVFNITINYISEQIVPELTDKWVKSNTDFSNVKEYKASLTEELEKNKKSDADANDRAAVFDKIVKASEIVEYPEKEYNNRYNSLVDQYKNYAEANSLEFEDYIDQLMGITIEQFESTAKSSAQQAVTQELILNEIARREGIEISDSDYQDFLMQVLTDSGYTEDTFESANGMTIVEYAQSKNLYTSLLYNRVMDKVMGYSKAK